MRETQREQKEEGEAGEQWGKDAHLEDPFFFFILTPGSSVYMVAHSLLLKPEGKPRCCVNYKENQ